MTPTKVPKSVQFAPRKTGVGACSVCFCLVEEQDQQRHRQYHLTNDK